MDWLNLHVSTLNSEALLRSEPTDRATWLFLLHYCIVQENGGVLRGASTWSDRTWQQLCRVTKEEVNRSCGLWSWDGDDLVVASYPLDKQREVQSKRLGGMRGGMAKTQAKTEAARSNGAKHNPSSTQAGTQRKGKEGKGRELEREAPPPPERGAVPLQAMQSASASLTTEAIESVRIHQRNEAIAYLTELEKSGRITQAEALPVSRKWLDDLRRSIAYNGPGTPPLGGPFGPLAKLKLSLAAAVAATTNDIGAAREAL